TTAPASAGDAEAKRAAPAAMTPAAAVEAKDRAWTPWTFGARPSVTTPPASQRSAPEAPVKTRDQRRQRPRRDTSPPATVASSAPETREQSLAGSRAIVATLKAESEA